jgi:hypothetical protein
VDIFDTDIEVAPPAETTVTQDLKMAYFFINALAWPYNSNLAYKTADDNRERDSRRISHFLQGFYHAHREMLSDLNKQGAGIYVYACKTDLYGMEDGNMVRPMALFVKTDGSITKPFAVPPSMTVKFNEMYNYYWLLYSDESINEFLPGQAQLANYYGTDAATNYAQMVRIPGFICHDRGEKKLVELVECDSKRRYSIKELRGEHKLELNAPVPTENLENMTADEALRIVDTVLQNLLGPEVPDGLRLFRPKTIWALASVPDEKRDAFEYKLRTILYRNNFLRSVVSLPTIRTRVKQAMRKRAQLKGK